MLAERYCFPPDSFVITLGHTEFFGGEIRLAEILFQSLRLALNKSRVQAPIERVLDSINCGFGCCTVCVARPAGIIVYF